VAGEPRRGIVVRAQPRQAEAGALAVADRIDPRIVFYDPVCPAPYTRATLATRALGGSEASAVRVAEALDAVVMQHCRRDAEGRYRPPGASTEARHVIVLRDARALRGIRARFPNARFHVWLHDRVERGSTRARWLAQADAALEDVTLVCVSEWLRHRVELAVHPLRSAPTLRTRVIFNPIADELAPAREFDADKLVFLSSPNKGLRYALIAFQALRRALPSLRFCVANPGYRTEAHGDFPGVQWLGTLTPAQTMEQAASALCVFMPNFLLPETFGLVFAEANALGTPVLAHDCGAAREVLHAANPVLPVRRRQRQFAWAMRALGWRAPHQAATLGVRAGLFDEYLELLRSWRSGQRPRVTGAARFRLSRVAQDWRDLLD
jgi:glycosyltransferase involved in cell wall biosynthesis